MSLPLFRLLDPIDAVVPSGIIVWEGPHEKAEGAYQRRYEIAEGHVILTAWHGKLHEITYQTPADDDEDAAERNGVRSQKRVTQEAVLVRISGLAEANQRG
jgi:hypothetical protein